MRDVEFWVMRIVANDDGSALDVWEALQRGDVQMVNGDIVEPIEMYRDERAAEMRAVRETRRTGHPHKVVLNADLDDSAPG